MAVDVTIPASGESISEVQIADWRKSEGEHVERDEIVCEIETDKASMELPAPASGRLSKILKQAGDMANVGDVIAHIETDGGGNGEPVAKRETPKPKDKAAAQRKPAGGKPEEKTPRAEVEEDHESDGEAEAEDAALRETQVDVMPRVMPAARRALAEHGLSESDVRGSGPGGRVLKEDVLRFVAGRQDARADHGVAASPQSPAGEREEEVVPMTMLRRRIAERLVESQQTAAILTTFNEIDMTAVKALREEFGEAFEKKYGVRLGFMSFFVKAAIEALKAIPQVNARIRDNDIVYHNYYDIGVAVSTDRGLVVPVLRNAERLSFAETERKIGEFAQQARERKIALEDLQGGTFTISNGGIYGSLLSTPIINPPQSGILGLHAIEDRPVVRDGQIVVRPMMYVALSYDHRLVDGRESVTFLKHVKELIESPARILIEI